MLALDGVMALHGAVSRQIMETHESSWQLMAFHVSL